MSHLARLASFLSLAAVASCGEGGGAPHAPGVDDALVTILTDALPAGRTGEPYEAAVAARGPHPPLVALVRGGRLPTGLSLDGDTGAISGWPRAPGRFRVTVEVRDGEDPALPRDATVAATRRSFDVSVERGPLVVLPFEVPPLQYASAFSHRFEAAGGVPPYAFTLSGGSIPDGTVLDRDGTLAGSPAGSAAPREAIVRATDAEGRVAERAFPLRIVVLPLSIVTAALPDAAAGFPYAAVPEVFPAGGGPPFSWRVAPGGGALPPGISVDEGTGRIAGTATAAGAYAFRLEATDVTGQTAGRDLAIRVNLGPVLDAVTPATLPRTGLPVTLLGHGFRPGMTATFGIAAAAPAAVLDEARATIVPPTSPVQSGFVGVTIRNEDGGAYTKTKGFRFPLATVQFVPAGVVGTARDHARGLAAGDLDRDGLADLVHVGSSGIEIVRPAKSTSPAASGGLVWTTKVVRSDGAYNDVRVADVDADGDLDVVASRSSTTETVEVYRNDGTGKFPAAPSVSTTYTKPPSHHFPYAIEVGDVTGDGVVDVALTSGRGGQGVVWILRGLGDGSFLESFVALDTIHDATNGLFGANAIGLGDLDGDGRADVVVTDCFPSACSAGQPCPVTGSADAWPGAVDLVAWTSLTSPAGVPSAWRAVRVSGTHATLDGDNLGLSLYDHDGDGRLDLAVFGGFQDIRGRGIAFLTGDGAGGFSERFSIATSYDRRYGARIDANLDACDDLIVVGGDGTVATGFGTGRSVAECWLGGTTTIPVKAWTSGPEDAAGGSIPDSNPGRVVVADFDGDGLLDFAVDQSFNSKERFGNDQGDGPLEGVAVYLNRSH